MIGEFGIFATGLEEAMLRQVITAAATLRGEQKVDGSRSGRIPITVGVTCRGRSVPCVAKLTRYPKREARREVADAVFSIHLRFPNQGPTGAKLK